MGLCMYSKFNLYHSFYCCHLVLCTHIIINALKLIADGSFLNLEFSSLSMGLECSGSACLGN